MAQVEIPDELRDRLQAILPLVESVLEEEVSFERGLEIVLDHGLNQMLIDVLGTADAAVLIASLQQLATKHPEEVYGYMTEIMARGTAVIREQAKTRLQPGFRATEPEPAQA